MTDTSKFVNAEQLGAIRGALVADYGRQQLNDPARTALPGQAAAFDVGAYQQRTLLGVDAPATQGAYDLAGYQADGMQASDELLSAMRQKAAVYSVSGEPSPEEQAGAQSAVGRIAGAGLHGLSTALWALDTPRRLTFEHAIVPAAHALGLTPADVPIDPTGRDVFVKALGGQALQGWLHDNVARLTGSEGLGETAGMLGTGAIGFGLDVLFDPLSFLDFGAGQGMKLGGRAIGEGGRELLQSLEQINRAAEAGKPIVGALPRIAEAEQAIRPEVLVARQAARAASAAGSGTVEQVASVERLGQQADTLSSIWAGLNQPGSKKLTYPEIDTLFEKLRGTGVDRDLFSPGGMHIDPAHSLLGGTILRLPKNMFSLTIPLLNREQNLSLFLGGREMLPDGVRAFDELRRTAMDLGEGALARIPIPEGVSQPLLAGGRKVRDLFTNYANLQKIPGGRQLSEGLKSLYGMPRAEDEYARALTERAFGVAGPITEEQKQQVFYLTRIGVPNYERDAAGNVVMDAVTGLPQEKLISLDDLADQLNTYNKRPTSTIVPGVGGAPATREFPEGSVTGQMIREQMEAHARSVEGLLDVAKLNGLVRPEITVQSLGGLRNAEQYVGRLPGTKLSAAEAIQVELDRVNGYLTTGLLPDRLVTSDLVRDPERFAQVVPDAQVRAVLSALHDSGAAPVASGIIPQITQLAQDFGQEGLTPNYLRTIYAYDAPMQRALRRLGPQIRTPGNIGKQRVASLMMEPEGLQAIGAVTDAPQVLANTLAQYRTQARHNQFLASVAEQWGKPLAAGEKPPIGWVTFNPTAMYAGRLTNPEMTAREIETFRQAGGLADEEAEALRGYQALTKVKDGTYAVPHEVALGVEQAANTARNAGGMFPLIDAYVGFLRGSVTSIFPSYHVRNIIGNLFNSHLGGVPMSDLSTVGDAVELLRGDPGNTVAQRVLGGLGVQAGGTTNLTGPLGRLDLASPTLRDDFLRLLRERGALGAGSDAIDRALTGDPARAATENVNKASDWLFGKGRTLGEYTDNVSRMRFILAKLKDGTPLEDTILQTKKFLFDFRDLTDTERNVFKNAAFFYSWTRKNVPLQLEMMLHQPRTYQYWNDAMRMVTDQQAEKRADMALMPAYIREQLHATVGQTNDGKLVVLSGLGLPIDDLNQFSFNSPKELIGQVVSQVNPLLRAALELGGMPSGVTNQRIDDESLTSYYRRLDGPLAWIATHTPGLGDWLGVQQRSVIDRQGKEVARYTADPTKMYALSNLMGMGRFFRLAGQVGTAAERGEWGQFAAQQGLGLHVSQVDPSRPLQSVTPSLETEATDEDTRNRMNDLAIRLAQGDITSKEWRTMHHDLLQQRAGQRQVLLRQQVVQDAPGAAPADIKSIEAIRQTYRTPSEQLADVLGAITSAGPEGVNPLTGEKFGSPREYYDARTAMRERIAREAPEQLQRSDAIQALRTSLLPPAAQAVDKQYQRALAFFQQYQDVPKFRGIPLGDQDAVDRARRTVRAYTETYGPGAGRAQVAALDPNLLSLARRGRPNTMQRRLAWQSLDRQSGGLLSRYFGDFPAQEFADLAPLAGEPGGNGEALT